MTDAEKPARLAVLIDGENTGPRVVPAVMGHARSLGTVTIARVYGNFAAPSAAGWDAHVHRYGMLAQQTFPTAAGKNSSDIAMVVDAMDLLHQQRVDGFCLASSDVDFTRLVVRIREAGLPVWVCGNAQTHLALRQAASGFFTLAPAATSLAPAQAKPIQPPVPAQATRPPAPAPTAGATKVSTHMAAPPAGAAASTSAAAQSVTAKTSPGSPAPRASAAQLNKVAQLVDKALALAPTPQSGWVPLTTVGQRLRVVHPGFASKSYGYTKLSDLVRATGRFDVQLQPKKSMALRRKAA